MAKIYISSDKDEFEKVLRDYASQKISEDRTTKIIRMYSSKYDINGEVVEFKGKRIHVDYLPSIDAMISACNKYKEPLEVVGAALFKIEKDHCLFFTDSNDPALKRVYEARQKKADKLADKLWRLTEEFDYQFSHVTAKVLSGAFATVFGITYGEWRRSLL